MIKPVLFITAVLACAIAVAAPPPGKPAPKSPTADDLVAKYIAARGGLTRIRSVQTLRQKGRVTAGPNQEGLVTRELKKPSKTRFEFKVQGVTSVFASDGKRGWKVDPIRGDADVKKLPDDVVSEAVEQGDFEGPLVDWKAKGHKIALAGRETVGDRPAYKLKVTLKSGGVVYDYLDVETSYLLRTEATRQIRGRPTQVQTTFGDFKTTDGLLFPGTVEVQAAGRPNSLRVTVDSVEVNPPLADARFQMPASAKP